MRSKRRVSRKYNRSRRGGGSIKDRMAMFQQPSNSGPSRYDQGRGDKAAANWQQKNRQ